MNDTGQHLTAEQLQALLDKCLPASDEEAALRHLKACTRCSSRFRSLERLDRSLRNLPRERVRDGFTREVMEKLHLAPSAPFGFRILENLAYVFGLLIVLGVMVAVFLWTGVIEPSQVTESGGVADRVMTDLGGSMSTGLTAFSRWIADYFPFAFSKGALGISVFVLIGLFLLLIVDRIVGKRYVQRTERSVTT